MFHRLTVRGGAGSILWGHRTAAVVRAWTIANTAPAGKPKVWRLAATVTRADAFQCRQRPLLFTAPRAKGMWCWGIESLELVGMQIRAVLGPPEQ